MNGLNFTIVEVKSSVMYRHIFVLLCLGLLPFFVVAQKNNTKILKYKSQAFEKSAKIWGFGVVRISNTVCNGSDGNEGTCYTRWQCKNIEGATLSGRCGGGVGRCCVIQLSCGTQSSMNNTYFVNQNYPAPTTEGQTCTFIIKKCSPDICQARIDFLSLSLAQPDAAGNCRDDVLIVTGGAQTIPRICGENSGQHIYVGFNGEQDIRITIVTSNAVTMNRSWKLKVSQIGCSCPTTAPAGCLMYYTTETGTVRSFNYGQTVASTFIFEDMNTIRAGTRQLVNTNYGICIQMQPGFCGIRWTQSPNDIYAFTVSGDTDMLTGNGAVGTPGAVQTDNCVTDFVIIPNPEEFDSDRFCGNAFPERVTTFSKPFVLTTVTNELEVEPAALGNLNRDFGNRGFSLSYTQLPCTNNIGRK